MEFKYEALDQAGKAQAGVVNAATQDAAIESLQRRGFTITALVGDEPKGLNNLLNVHVPFLAG